MAALGFLAAFWTASRRAPLAGLHPDAILDLAPWLIGGAIVGARLWYVVAYWDSDFASRPFHEVFMIRRGGLVWYGGFAGACLTVIIYTAIKKAPLWTLADVIAPSVPLGHAFGRVGCFLHGCCFGSRCDLPWAVHFPADHPTGGEGVHPTQLYEAGLNLLLYAALAWAIRRRKFDGQIFGLYLVGYAFVRGVVEVFRGDYSVQERVAGLIKPGQFVSVLILVIGLVLLWKLQNRPPVPPVKSK